MGIGAALAGDHPHLAWLTVWAGVGLMIVAISASGLHFSRGEISSGIITAVLFALPAFVTYMRWKVKPLGGVNK